MATVLSILGVCLSVATLITVTSVMNGFVDELVEKIIGVNSHISLSNRSGKITVKNAQKAIDGLIKISEVKSVNSVINGQGMVINPKNNSSAGVFIKGMDINVVKSRDALASSIEYVDKFTEKKFNKDGILIGVYLASSLGVTVGDTISLVVSKGKETDFGFIPSSISLRVDGIFDTGSSLNDSASSIISMKNANHLFEMKGSVSEIEIFTHDYHKVNLIKYEIYNSGIWKHIITDWQTANAGLFEAMKVERVAMSFILSLFLIVSMFGIFANMNNLVTTKMKNIAIMMSMGISKRAILAIFFIAGFCISLIGVILGCAIGIAFTKNIQSIKNFLQDITGTDIFNPAIYFLSYLPSKVYFDDVVLICTLALFCGIFFALIPARRASKVKIVETLRQI